MADPALDIRDQEIYLVMSTAERIRDQNIELIKNLMAQDHYLIVITTNQPYDVLKRSYEAKGIPLDRIFFIDTVTKYALGYQHDPVPNCKFVNNPGDLTNIGIAVTTTLSRFKDQKVSLLFDSVNAMLIYISSQNITKFIHFVTTKLRLMNFTGIFIAVEKGLDPEVFTQLVTFVDRVIDIDEKIP